MGVVVITHPDQSGRVYKVRQAPSLRRLQKIVGGYIELVPHWDRFAIEPGKWQPARVFCNEDGKRLQLPINHVATQMWFAINHTTFPDYLVGNVVIVAGSQRWLDEWDEGI